MSNKVKASLPTHTSTIPRVLRTAPRAALKIDTRKGVFTPAPTPPGIPFAKVQ